MTDPTTATTVERLRVAAEQFQAFEVLMHLSTVTAAETSLKDVPLLKLIEWAQAGMAVQDMREELGSLLSDRDKVAYSRLEAYGKLFRAAVVFQGAVQAAIVECRA